MAIEVRPYESTDEGYWRVRELTYNNGLTIPAENRVLKVTHAFVAEEKDEIVGAYNVLDLTCTCRGAVFECGGVAGVGVHPALRSTGVGSAMMRHAIIEMRQHGVLMASLYAYREWYYRRFGYEVCGMRYEIACPSHRFAKIDAELPIRTMGPKEWEPLQPCHREFALARNGMSLRDQRLWDRILSEKNVVYAAGDPVEAYAVVQHEVDFWKDQPIQEIVWSTGRGYRTILSLLANIGVNKTGVTWREPSDSPFLSGYLDKGAELKMANPIMYRVTDVPEALRKIHTAATGEFTLLVRDSVVPENVGPWRVSFSPGGVQVNRTDTAELEMTVQTFTQALLGEPNLHDLGQNGFVNVRSANALATAELLLPPARVHCIEFF